MKRQLFILIGALMCAFFISTTTQAQTQAVKADTTIFAGRITNKDYDIYIQMDFYHNNLTVPEQEVYGEMSGYIGDNRDGRKWFITSAELTDSVTAHLDVINDYGSEDLTATLRRLPNGTYQLRQEDGSVIKFARDRKWMKLPKTLIFTRKK